MSARFLSVSLLTLVGVSTNAIARPWTPADTNIAIVAWYDASDASTVLTSGTSVTNWLDKSGNNRTASQTTTANQPTYTNNVLNGLPVVGFDGGDLLTISGTFSLRNIFIVLNCDSGATFPDWLWAWGAWTASNNKTGGIYGWDGTTLLSAPDSVMWIDGATDGTKDGDFAPLSSYKIAGALRTENTTSRSDWKIGKGDRYWNGGIAEIVGTASVLTTIDRQKIEGYLAWKWGLQGNLPVGHPYKDAAPTVPDKGMVIIIR